jgi:hypothetical protein
MSRFENLEGGFSAIGGQYAKLRFEDQAKGITGAGFTSSTMRTECACLARRPEACSPLTPAEGLAEDWDFCDSLTFNRSCL